MPLPRTQPPRCPETYVLDKYTFGILTEPDFSTVNQHLLVCPECQEKSDSLGRAIIAFAEADEQRAIGH